MGRIKKACLTPQYRWNKIDVMVERMINTSEGRPQWQKNYKKQAATKVRAEVVEKGVEEGKRVMLLGERDPHIVIKVEGGSIYVRNELTQRPKKPIGIGAIERVLE